MPPTKRTTRGRPRSTSAGDDSARSARPSSRRRGRSTASMHTLLQAARPSASLVRQDFDDEPALRQVIHEVAQASGIVDIDTEQRMRLMEHRQEASDKLLHEMHAMVCDLRQSGGGQLTQVLGLSRSSLRRQLPLVLTRCLGVTEKFLPRPRLVS